MNKLGLCSVTDARYVLHMGSKNDFENPSVAQLRQALAEVATLQCALSQSRENSEISVQEIKTLVERNLRLTQEVTLLKEKESKALYLAYHDQLTGLPNRRLLRDRLNQAFAQAVRQNKQVAVLVMDLDGFKAINDRLGHTAGDQLLQQVAKRLTDCVRMADTVCRYGGDEFVVMLPEFDEGETVSVVVEKIRSNLDVSYVVDGDRITVKASIGVAVYPRDGNNYRALIKQADIAMYRAKANQTSRESSESAS